ncbi:hypothetical protein FACS189490_10960 [Clostridia bacterium]|nr:hypothetical protein FACS189490_10960 [Clostridia bacterium]
MFEFVIFLVGVSVGLLLSFIVSRSKPSGLLRIANSKIDKEPYLFLELKEDISSISSKKHVIFAINTQNFIPHK